MLPKLNGVIVPHRKNTATIPAVKMPTPKSVTIPMNMHIGAPSIPCVKVGDEVKVGQLIAEAGGFVSEPIFSSVSGTVKKIEKRRSAPGGMVDAIIVENDNQYETVEFTPLLPFPPGAGDSHGRRFPGRTVPEWRG